MKLKQKNQKQKKSTQLSTAPAARRPPGYVRPTQRPVMPTPPPRRPPTPPPRGSSPYGDRNGGFWSSLFGGGGGSGGNSRPSSGGSYPKPTSKPSSKYNSGGKDYYQTHTSTDSKGNKVWTFSG